MATENKKQEKSPSAARKQEILSSPSPVINIENLSVPAKIKTLIKHGKDDSYPSRSEADMAVIVSLVNKGLGRMKSGRYSRRRPLAKNTVTIIRRMTI